MRYNRKCNKNTKLMKNISCWVTIVTLWLSICRQTRACHCTNSLDFRVYRVTLSVYVLVYCGEVWKLQIKKVRGREGKMPGWVPRCEVSLMRPMGVITHTKARHSLNTLLMRSDTVLITSPSNMLPADTHIYSHIIASHDFTWSSLDD